MNAKTLSGSRVVLLLCGSFNPPTFLHLRMFERARDFLQQDCHCQVLEGLMSPVSDHFMKPDLLSSQHRLRMTQLATESSKWIRADGWESSQPGWTRTVEVLRHHRQELRRKYSDDQLRLIMLCGGDTVDSFVRKEPRSPDGRLWQVEHLTEIFDQFGLIVIQRTGASAHVTLDSAELDFLHQLSANAAIIEDSAFPNAMSSSRLRSALKLGQSVRYCTPDAVVQYIRDCQLYQKMRPLTDPEMEMLTKKLSNYISADNIRLLLERSDGTIYVFRVNRDRVYYCSEQLARQAACVTRKLLLSFGTCLGKFTHSGKRFFLHITALDYLAPYASGRVWLKPQAEQQFLYGNNVVKSGVSRMSDGVETNRGVIVYSMSDVPLGFGIVAKNTTDCRRADPTALVLLHQSDLGEYIRNEALLT